MPSEWHGFVTKDGEDCGSEKRWRYHEDGRIEIEGEGIPVAIWPERVNDHEDLIRAAAIKYDIPPHWLATIMAIESGGREEPGCLRMQDGRCHPREGAGLMATTPETAARMVGEPYTAEELHEDPSLAYEISEALIADPALAVDAGSAAFRHQLDRYDGDFVSAVLAYNAGSVRCGTSYTFGQPKEPCPDPGWGVKMGCVYTTKDVGGGRCAPAENDISRPWKCSVDYPRNAITMNNTALVASPFGEGEPLTLPLAPPPASITAGRAIGAIAVLGLGAAIGFYGLTWGREQALKSGRGK